MTYSEQRAALVAAVISREGKNQYTQGSKRDQVASGWSDCSSLMRWAHEDVLGIYIGGNTEAQIVSSKLTTVDVPIFSGVPDEVALLPGDLLFFRGRSLGRKSSQYVGHVEMYIGNGQLMGHGSGTGPTRKAMADYCRQRQASSSPVPEGNRGLICIRRAVTGMDPDGKKGDWDGMDTTQFVKDLYVQLLGREADEDGLKTWINEINNGKSFLDIYEGFANSTEGRRRFVREQYHHLLGREGKDTEVQFWVDQLASGKSHEEVYLGFVNSPEYQRNHQ